MFFPQRTFDTVNEALDHEHAHILCSRKVRHLSSYLQVVKFSGKSFQAQTLKLILHSRQRQKERKINAVSGGDEVDDGVEEKCASHRPVCRQRNGQQGGFRFLPGRRSQGRRRV
jgi:hypothetical protein